VEHFSWDHKHPDGRKGREVVLDLKRSIERRAPVQADNLLNALHLPAPTRGTVMKVAGDLEMLACFVSLYRGI